MKKFIQGALFVSLIIPIIDGLIPLFNQIIKHICTWIATKTYKLEKQLSEENTENQSSSQAIGFQIQNQESEEDYEGEE